MPDERDPKISQHYRDLEALEPPGELDQAILAAGRRAISGRQRWYYSLAAAAAVLVFAVALTLHMERERPDSEAGPQLRLERELRGEIKPAPETEAKPPEPKAPAARQAEPAPHFTPEPAAPIADSAASASQ